MNQPVLEVKDLCLKRDGREILHHVDLLVYPGQIHALLGLNGSGKSSLAYTIMGCEGYTPDSGSLLFDGKDLSGLSITERARLGITLAWQEPARFEGIPIGKYVSLGLPQPDREKVASALEAVSLPPKVYGYRAADQLLRRFGDSVQVNYFDLFDPDCPPLPEGAQLPLVLVNGRVVSSGGKISIPAIRRYIEDMGLVAARRIDQTAR